MATNQHPCLSYYGDTRPGEFPLLLVVGRAPNCAQNVDHKRADQYHFVKGQIAKFWTTSYSFAAGHHRNAPNVTGTQFRHECVKLNLSPIIFADALPRGVVNGNPVGAAAAPLTQVQIEQHVDAIFAPLFADLVSRIHLIVLAGLRTGVVKGSQQFGWAADRFQHHASRRGIIWAELPFFIGYNSRSIAQQWAGMKAPQVALSHIMLQFP